MERNNKITKESPVQHVFIVGAKSIGQYGGYETFVDRLIRVHENEPSIQYHVACKANGDGCMDEAGLEHVKITEKYEDGSASEFTYRNAHIFKIRCPDIGPAVAVWYDRAALLYSIRYCEEHRIENPIFYILTCRIGLFINGLAERIRHIGGRYYLNPDGHEWLRAKWSVPVRRYWKWSERKMVAAADLVICDSVNIEKYIRFEYNVDNTVYIAYGADIEPSPLSDDDSEFLNWLKINGLEKKKYYLVVGRFVPENNYETMIREFMSSDSDKHFAIITNGNTGLKDRLEKKLHFSSDSRIRFAGTVYDQALLKKIRENAYGYIHGHEVGGTNPSLLEALASTDLNMLLDVGFNREVGQDAVLYWNKKNGSLAAVIDKADQMREGERVDFGRRAKARIRTAYSWEFIGKEYQRAWMKK